MEEYYSYSIDTSSIPWQVSFKPTIKNVLDDLENNIPVGKISAKFHNTLARVILTVAEKTRKQHQIDTVVLIGGVFLNKVLLRKASYLLQEKGFDVLRPILYSPNDESISLGQIAYGLEKIRKEKSILG